VTSALIVLLVVLGGVGSHVYADQPLTNEFCPVTTTERVDKNVYVDYQGKRVYFCCKNCRKDFLADPEKYLANLPQFAETADHGEMQASGSSRDDDHSRPHSHDDTLQAQQAATGGSAAGVVTETQAEPAHDHATDHSTDESDGSVITFLGKFHPVVVHFPIALILTGFFFAWLTLFYKKEIFEQAGIWITYLAALSAVVGVLLGLAAGSEASYPELLAGYFSWHRILGISTGVLSLLSAYLAFRFHRNPSSRNGWCFRVSLLLAAALVGITGHFGATLIYGPDHFSF
jgi:uncharacterized membrane protein/YHS domain-containing protein